jgi:hypothetical protein
MQQEFSIHTSIRALAALSEASWTGIGVCLTDVNLPGLGNLRKYHLQVSTTLVFSSTVAPNINAVPAANGELVAPALASAEDKTAPPVKDVAARNRNRKSHTSNAVTILPLESSANTLSMSDALILLGFH